MRRKLFFLPNMVQAITVLTVLKMLTNAQSSCNQGLGRLVYERLPDHQLQGFDEEHVKDSAGLPPFRVLEKCQELCTSDRTQENLVRACTSFDFIPGSRTASFPGIVQYDASICLLSRERSSPDGNGVLILSPNSVHYNEICLSSSRIEKECSAKHYVFERHPHKKLKLPVADMKEIITANRTECEDKCLDEYSFICRSATYDILAKTCWLSQFTRRTHPELLEDDPNADYLENTCLNAERRCDGSIIFVKEENKRLGGPFEMDIFTNISLMECQTQCVKADKFFCRAVEYDEFLKRCILFEEDSVSQRDDLRTSNSPTNDLYDLVCLDHVRNAPEFSDNSLTSHLFQETRRPDTAFQRYRNSKLGSESHSEITGRSLSECLDECLRQVSFQCKSAVYSERYRICRLSRFSQRDGQRMIYDADYDYYENLMGAGAPSATLSRPDTVGQAFHGHPVVRPASGGYNGIYGGGNFPGYSPAGAQYPGSSHSSSDFGYPSFNSYPTHSTDSLNIGGSPGVSGSGYHGSVTPIPNLYPPTSSPSGYSSSLPPTGGVSPLVPYPPSFGGAGLYPGLDNRPFTARCDEQDSFKQVGIHKKMRRPYVRRATTVPTLANCEKECADAIDFVCRSFNYRAAPFGTSRENCELSDRDTRDFDMANANFFDNAGDYDFYERTGFGRNNQDCLDVGQTCSEDGMEFTLRTPEGFLGRIYTHGFYDRCFYKGNGGQVNVLRISGAQGYPDCGTTRFGDMMSNIVVVQFSDYVQTSRDKRYNLTCLFRGPGEATVTSGYMTANSGGPIPIEYLPAENSLSSRVRLSILYQNRPVNTIAVGDPLTFRLESQDGYNYATDIFASNVIARDPYSGRSVQLIDRYGCPVNNDIFPALDKSRQGDGLEARFNAFKIPESNYLVFEATVKTCREGCTPAYCQVSGPNGRTESLGRRRRDTSEEENTRNGDLLEQDANITTYEEYVRDLFKVLDERFYETPEQLSMEPLLPNVCLTNREYYTMLTFMFSFIALFIGVTIIAGYYYKKYWTNYGKNQIINTPPPHYKTSTTRSSLLSVLTLNTQNNFNNSRNSEYTCSQKPEELQLPGETNNHLDRVCPPNTDPSEPIYTDTSFFECSRSLRSEQFDP